MANHIVPIWGSEKQKYFCKRDWTGQISLIRLNKFRFARNGIARITPTDRADKAMVKGILKKDA
jgi:hypothetical protein